MSKRNKRRIVNAKGYGDAGASVTKRALRGFNAQSGAPAEDIDFNNFTLRQRSRMLYMSSPIAASAINTNRTKVVGTGLHLRCNINRDILGLSDQEAEEWQKKTEMEWQMWASKKANCDAVGLNNFYEIQQLVLKSWLMSGDVFVLFKRYEPTALQPYSLRLHIIEADRISTPRTGKFVNSAIGGLYTEGKNITTGNRIHDGVEVDDNGMVVAYHICSVYPGQSTIDKEEWQRVTAYGENTGLPNILHIMESERADQYRGVSILAPIIEVLLQVRRYTEAQLTAAIVQSFLTAWITTQSDPTDFPLGETGAGEYEGMDANEPDSISEDDNELEMGPGNIMHLQEGENVTFGNPNIPTAGFTEFVKTMAQQAGAALGIPYDVLLKEFNASYSASKGALEEAWETIKERRTWLVDDFCQPSYEVWLAEAVARGRINAPGFFDDPLIREAWCGARWDGPAQTHLDPVKEATADEMLVSNGWKTNEQVTREHYGGDWEANIEILRREQEKAMAQSEIMQGGNDNGDIQNVPDESDNAEPDRNASKRKSWKSIFNGNRK